MGHNLLKFDTVSKGKLPYIYRMPNIWLSSYVVTPTRAAKLLQLMKEKSYDFNVFQFDVALIKATEASHINFYVVDETNKYFIHTEDDSDKKNINGKMSNFIFALGVIVKAMQMIR